MTTEENPPTGHPHINSHTVKFLVLCERKLLNQPLHFQLAKMSFAKERPKSAGPLRRNSPLTIRQLVPSEFSSLTASFVPNTKPELCQHQNPAPLTVSPENLSSL
jgi:hypothetical protein